MASLAVRQAFCAAYVLLPEHPWFQAAKRLVCLANFHRRPGRY